MTRPLRLALIMLLMGAGVVIAAPVVTNTQKGQFFKAEDTARQAVRNEFVLHVDRTTGCVWRISAETGRRNLDPLPCKRPKLKSSKAEQATAASLATAAVEPVPAGPARSKVR
jgi:hypothetical protein